MQSNEFINQVSVLAELWMNYRDEEQLEDFIEYNDLGLPLAYLLHNEMVELREGAEVYISESYALLLASLGIEDDSYESLDEMLQASNDMED